MRLPCMRTVFNRPILACTIPTALTSAVAGETNYFLVAEPPVGVGYNDSYVLPLSKQEDIDHARYIIALGSSVFTSNHLVVAKVVAAKDDINRNFLDPKFPKWSWQV